MSWAASGTPIPPRGPRAWPDGRITHTSIDVGTYDVVVTEAWRAAWSFGDASGVIESITTTGTMEDFPVGQLQAVVVG